MKKNIIIIAAMFGMVFGMSSCEDFLETDSTLQIVNPELDQKTDSMFYTLGILKGVQQAIDQYVLVNEMRGDLTATNTYTATDLRELADFSATVENKYDSAYVFYRIINNCNYYIAHRDTSLRTGARQVAMQEYVQAKSIRAWAYLQLAKIYGEVPFYTDPVTSISEANAVLEKKDIQGICDALMPDLQKHVGTPVPDYGTINAGVQNNGGKKEVRSSLIMFPIDLVIGDLYLETHQYEKAAQAYFNYLRLNRKISAPYAVNPNNYFPASRRTEFPNDFRYSNDNQRDWGGIFSKDQNLGYTDIVTYVPMAVNRLYGTTTDLPRIFGYDYYTTNHLSEDTVATSVSSDMYLLEREVTPSKAYTELSNNQMFYYIPGSSTVTVNAAALGDMRAYYTWYNTSQQDSSFSVMRKFFSANIPVYRVSTIYLRLAEAINRMGYPDAAFCILKDGLYNQLDENYVTSESKEMLQTVVPFYSDEYHAIFDGSVGIHSHGAGYVRGKNTGYQFEAIVGQKIAELQSQFGLELEYTKNDTINAVEDIICDEYALELAYEGHRFGDLCRLARHKNLEGLYQENFGSLWLKSKLEYKNPVVDLLDEENWYMPFSR